ncbi:hypothetical protein LEM8419_00461 [Neolewinella maritima]|uniref:Uncharacterized protein n=1 Tax=Neolewinella maritima TaxID=1383882 RepID=A0ABM9AWQ5_9BACT|nr:hypothetical protein LEM8419_00461 [Neolewinella maritima]
MPLDWSAVLSLQFITPPTQVLLGSTVRGRLALTLPIDVADYDFVLQTLQHVSIGGQLYPLEGECIRISGAAFDQQGMHEFTFAAGSTAPFKVYDVEVSHVLQLTVYAKSDPSQAIHQRELTYRIYTHTAHNGVTATPAPPIRIRNSYIPPVALGLLFGTALFLGLSNWLVGVICAAPFIPIAFRLALARWYVHRPFRTLRLTFTREGQTQLLNLPADCPKALLDSLLELRVVYTVHLPTQGKVPAASRRLYRAEVNVLDHLLPGKMGEPYRIVLPLPSHGLPPSQQSERISCEWILTLTHRPRYGPERKHSWWLATEPPG